MFDQLVRDVASRFNLDTSSVATLVRGLLGLMASERTGGIDGFMRLFQQAGLGNTVSSWLGGHEGAPISPTQLETALGGSTVERLAASAGVTRGVASAVLAYALPKVVSALSPAGVLPSSSALLSKVSGYLSPAPAIDRVETATSAWPRWLPWAALALVGLVAWLWLRAPAAGTIDPQLTVTNTDGRITYSGVVRDEATRSAVANALRATFGDANVSGDLRVDGNVRQAPWLARLGEILTSLRQPGVEFTLNGNSLSLGGWLSAADRQALSDKARGLLGAGATIGSLADRAAEAVTAANQRAMSALTALGSSAVTGAGAVQAMNLSVINFATGSAELPADSAALIRGSADALKHLPAGTQIEIGGHTDNTGDAASNLKLSEARAAAVQNALVANGAPAAMLTIKGYGDTKPRASNDSEYGRFQNRRIEYTLIK